MAATKECPFSVNELEWKCFLQTYEDRFNRILDFYNATKNHNHIVNCVDENLYSFECLTNKNRIYVVLSSNLPETPSPFLMYNVSLIESTLIKR